MRTSPHHRPTGFGADFHTDGTHCSGPKPPLLLCTFWKDPTDIHPLDRCCLRPGPSNPVSLAPDRWPAQEPDGLCQMWDVGHQPLIIIISSYYLILGERTCWVVWDNLIYTCCPGTILNRIFIHSRKYHLIRDVRAYSSS